jgi:hypothetical protein
VARHVRWTVALALTTGLLACGSGGGSPGATGQETSTPAPSAGAAVAAALDFEAPLVGGGRFDARAAAGRPLALWFWAPH